MGDSDEEHDRRRRDKFRGERNDYDNRRPAPNRYDRGRPDRMSGGGHSSWDRGSKRDYYGGNKDQGRDRRDSFGRGSSPPQKKSKRDWESNDHQGWRGSQDSNAILPADKSSSGIPMLMSFKNFIIQQEDDINEVESVRRYQEYKVEFKRTQINDFFVLHKNEEWFEEKYHPVKSVERRKVIRKGLRKRLEIFLDLWENGYFDEISLNITDSSAVLKLLDRAVVRLEGGTEEDVKALDLPPVTEKREQRQEANGSPNSVKKEDTKESENKEENEEEGGEEKEPLPPGMEDEDEPLPPGMEDEEEKVKTEDASMEEEEDKTEDSAMKKEEEPEEADKKVDAPNFIYDGLHLKRPLSVFMRTVPANVTRNDLVTVCKRYPGFLRLAMSEPSPERRYARRAWATFEHDVNIKDINWSLSNIRVKDVELNPVVNRDVTNRIRPINGISCSPMMMQLDIQFALKLLRKLDSKHQLYEKEEVNGHGDDMKKEDEQQDVKEEDEDGESVKTEEKEEGEEEKKETIIFPIPDSNPVLEKLPPNVEKMVTGLELENEDDDKKEYAIVVNDDLVKALDLVLLYLRIVHCIDYYNSNEYVHEDEMPMRCGIMHVRGPPLEAASKKDVHECFKQNAEKLEHVLKDDESATSDEAESLGKKIEETEVENFIKANTQELAKDKWLCPLSGKKFRGPEFIRKHIMMKHNDSVDNVKDEVQFFNNYIYDMKRPCFPDAKPRTGMTSSTGTTATSGNENRTWNSQSRQPVVFATPARPPFASSYQPTTPQSAPPDTYGRVNTYPPKSIKQRVGGGPYRDRRIIRYRDLDAPEESDFF